MHHQRNLSHVSEGSGSGSGSSVVGSGSGASVAGGSSTVGAVVGPVVGVSSGADDADACAVSSSGPSDSSSPEAEADADAEADPDAPGLGDAPGSPWAGALPLADALGSTSSRAPVDRLLARHRRTRIGTGRVQSQFRQAQSAGREDEARDDQQGAVAPAPVGGRLAVPAALPAVPVLALLRLAAPAPGGAPSERGIGLDVLPLLARVIRSVVGMRTAVGVGIVVGAPRGCGRARVSPAGPAGAAHCWARSVSTGVPQPGQARAPLRCRRHGWQKSMTREG